MELASLVAGRDDGVDVAAKSAFEARPSSRGLVRTPKLHAAVFERQHAPTVQLYRFEISWNYASVLVPIGLCTLHESDCGFPLGPTRAPPPAVPSYQHLPEALFKWALPINFLAFALHTPGHCTEGCSAHALVFSGKAESPAWP